MNIGVSESVFTYKIRRWYPNLICQLWEASYFQNSLFKIKHLQNETKHCNPNKKLSKRNIVNIFLTILKGKKHRQIKLQRLQKVWMWRFGSLVHQINSLEGPLKLTQHFQYNEVVTDKTPFSVIGPFYGHHSNCPNIDFWYGSFVWKRCVFHLSAFN